MERVIFEKYNAETRKRTRIVTDESGYPLIVHDQDTDPIVEDNKRQATMRDGHQLRAENVQGAVMVAHIPNIVFWRLMKLGIAQDPKAMKKWLSRRDTRMCRTDDGRSLV